MIDPSIKNILNCNDRIQNRFISHIDFSYIFEEKSFLLWEEEEIGGFFEKGGFSKMLIKTSNQNL